MTHELEKEFESGELSKLFEVLADMHDPKEVGLFLRDILTRVELKETGRRLAVAKRLDDGQTQRNIAADTGVRTATVSRVSTWLNHGTGGYGLALKRLKGPKP